MLRVEGIDLVSLKLLFDNVFLFDVMAVVVCARLVDLTVDW